MLTILLSPSSFSTAESQTALTAIVLQARVDEIHLTTESDLFIGVMIITHTVDGVIGTIEISEEASSLEGNRSKESSRSIGLGLMLMRSKKRSELI